MVVMLMTELLVRLKTVNEQKQSELNEITLLSKQKEELLEKVKAVDERIKKIRKKLMTMEDGESDG